MSENSWIDRRITLEWLKHFNRYTQPQTRGNFRLLILDRYTSHISLEFVQYYEDYKIIPLYLSPYSTYILQPLDIGIFSSLTKAYKTRI